MKKIGIITIQGLNNYGNRLQNYALQEQLKKYNFDVVTINNEPKYNTKKHLILRYVKSFIKKEKIIIDERKKRFIDFNKNINISSKIYNAYNISKLKLDYYVTGSDQVWNPNIARLRYVDMLGFADPKKRVSYSASFGIDRLPSQLIPSVKKYVGSFKAISVREDKGKEILEKIGIKKNIEVLIDPTMLLTDKEWDKVSKRPNMLKNDKYILNYFLGKLSEQRENEIKRIAKEYNCEIINILDKNSPFFVCGPSEFLYLEKHAFLICTDSFHSSVFSIIYNRPFIVFDREEKGMENMGSRIDTLINKFNLKNRRYNGKKITSENLKHDYSEAYKILEEERNKSDVFLRESFNIKDCDKNE